MLSYLWVGKGRKARLQLLRTKFLPTQLHHKKLIMSNLPAKTAILLAYPQKLFGGKPKNNQNCTKLHRNI